MILACVLGEAGKFACASLLTQFLCFLLAPKRVICGAKMFRNPDAVKLSNIFVPGPKMARVQIYYHATNGINLKRSKVE
jgi:hypothetical protein